MKLEHTWVFSLFMNGFTIYFLLTKKRSINTIHSYFLFFHSWMVFFSFLSTKENKRIHPIHSLFLWRLQFASSTAEILHFDQRPFSFSFFPRCHFTNVTIWLLYFYPPLFDHGAAAVTAASHPRNGRWYPSWTWCPAAKDGWTFFRRMARVN